MVKIKRREFFHPFGGAARFFPFSLREAKIEDFVSPKGKKQAASLARGGLKCSAFKPTTEGIKKNKKRKPAYPSVASSQREDRRKLPLVYSNFNFGPLFLLKKMLCSRHSLLP